ncbi:hypothetical protein AWB81_07378 [Caballeronia arationis]|uniref:hypothetical protein n=1 Tax=Caballeronia arationis TaxID=1777142 RepID=UPI00074B4089|nr:hypothetical protein [Caballeronia arationis]SAL05954.1 hypothetical protein AWB81_07378 [Caballeronia arationis]
MRYLTTSFLLYTLVFGLALASTSSQAKEGSSRPESSKSKEGVQVTAGDTPDAGAFVF